ncbi:GAF domain-containing protein [Okeania sp.]|uniref:GAF domain-containing protein n=1 Tax=Okeania sp. TaxID=3100323 RepID=UPI002B4AE318|nr:adenylate/guanylate cyclase domain-containing protein [Okeania sp.]MEB3342515.1 adenylate/guanylate cyclase domain-containing protein [Okeania sp.]
MTSTSPNHIAREYTIPIEDVEVIEGNNHEVSHPHNNNYDYKNPEINSTNTNGDNHKNQESSALVHPGSGANFSEFLAPLTKKDFTKVVKDVEEKLKTVNQTLGMLNNLLEAQGFDAILHEMLRSITIKTGELLNADRTTIWLLDEEKEELWSTVAQGANGKPLELRISANVGIAGESAQGKKIINIPYDFYDDPRSASAKKFDKQNGYRTYSMIVMPLLQEETGDLIAVVQLLNKLKSDAEQYELLEEKIDISGFTEEDQRVFNEFAPSISLILESSKSFYAATQRQRAAEALMKAVDSLSKSSLDLEDTLKKVMNQAKELMNADRSTLWLIDNEKNDLWTKIPIDGKLTEIRIAKDKGFAGMVATSGEPLLIPFDVYTDARSVTAKETDEKTGYRTCSLLCMPVFNADNELIGVTQLINKKKQGEYPPYNHADWPKAPEQWRASFNRNDLEFMKAFNIQAGVALQNAKLFHTVKQEQQRQKDILRSLSNGVISTDKKGKVIATNESARHLLGISETEIVAGKNVKALVSLKEGEFSKWLDSALSPSESKEYQQYYPDQTLLPQGGLPPQSINLSINSMIDALEPTRVNGVLVVMEDITGEKQVKNLMYRYMTPEVAEKLLETGDTGLGGKRNQVSVLFSDIRSYTTLTEGMEAEEVVSMLNEYFEEMVDAVFKYKGTLDKYIGDALMAVFGAPGWLDDHPLCAMKTAVEMRQRLKVFNQKRIANQKKAISIGMGIHSDEVVSGNIGSSKRMELTSIGDGVNLASRLEGTSKQYGTDLIISYNTYEPYKEKLWVRELDFITVKGKSQPVRIYELLGFKEGDLKQDLTDQQHQIVEYYHQGREYYLRPAREKNLKETSIKEAFELAEAEFKKVLEIDPNNKAAKLHVGRCQLFQAELPPQDWDGVWKLTEK